MDAKVYKGRDWFLTPMPTMGVSHGRARTMPLFSTMGATQIISVMNLLKSYRPMAFVLGATRKHRILLVYGRPYTSKYTDIYLSVYGRIPEVYFEVFALILARCVPVACACAHGPIGQLAHI